MSRNTLQEKCKHEQRRWIDATFWVDVKQEDIIHLVRLEDGDDPTEEKKKCIQQEEEPDDQEFLQPPAVWPAEYCQNYFL